MQQVGSETRRRQRVAREPVDELLISSVADGTLRRGDWAACGLRWIYVLERGIVFASRLMLGAMSGAQPCDGDGQTRD